MNKGTIERAFELAPDCVDIEQVRTTLKREGYGSVDAHLSGRAIQTDLRKRLGGSVPVA
jgi:hypothetical protein